MSLLLGLAGAPAVDVKVSWLEFDSGEPAIDVKVSWLQFDSGEAPPPEPEQQTLGGVTRRPFPQVQRRRETEEEKLARRIEQGIVKVEPKLVEPAKVEEPKQDLAAIERQLDRRIKRANAANQQALGYIEAATAQAQAAQIADEEIRRIQSMRETEEADVLFVMSVLANA